MSSLIPYGNNDLKILDPEPTGQGGVGLNDNIRATEAALAGLQKVKYVHLIDGVTGTGTTGDPYVGWDTAVNASVAGDSWYFVEGYFQTANEILIAVSNVSLVGSGRGTVIRSTYSTANKATIHTSVTLPSFLVGLRISDLTLDGNGATPLGLYIENTHWSEFKNITFQNHVDWCSALAFCVGDRFDGLLARSTSMSTVTTNGIYLGYSGSSQTDKSITTCHFNVAEFYGMTGYGVKIDYGFGNVFTGGAFEVCGIPLNTGSGTSNNLFNGIDFEAATGAGIQLGSTGESFVGCRCDSTALTISGAGQHRFVQCVISYPTDTGTIGSSYIDTGYSKVNWAAQTGTGNSVFSTDGGLYLSKRNAAVASIVSGNGAAAGSELISTGNRVGNVLTLSAGTYLIDGTGLADYLSATLEGAYAVKISGRATTLGGTLTVTHDTALANLLVNSGGVAQGIQLDGASYPAYIISASGVVKGYWTLATSPGGFLNDSATNDIIFRAESGRVLFGVGANNATLAVTNGAVTVGGTLKVTGGTPGVGKVLTDDGSGTGQAVWSTGGAGTSGYSGYSGFSGFSGYSGYSGKSGYSGYSGFSGYSGYSGSGASGLSGATGATGSSGFSGYSGKSGFSGYSGYSGTATVAIAQNSQSADYTTVLGDAGKHIFHPSADTTARTWTIDSNANVAYPLGTAITFINQNSAGVITIAITTDIMRLAGAGTTGSRTLAANGIATAVKVVSGEWLISGTGLT